MFALVVTSEIGADLRPILSVIGRFKNRFGGGINHVGVVRRKKQWRDPLKAMKKIDRAVPGIILRPDAHVLILLLTFFVTRDVALAVRINDVPIARIRQNKSAFTAARNEPILRANHARVRATRYADIRVVLLRAINVIRIRVVHRDVIKLRSRLIVLSRPGFAPIT